MQWDQRGAGKTYLGTPPAQVEGTIHIERFVDDAIEVMALLRERYGKRKVFAVGHSWGTIVGLKAALEKPEWVLLTLVERVRPYAFSGAKRER